MNTIRSLPGYLLSALVCIMVAQPASARPPPPVEAPTLASRVELAAGDVGVSGPAGRSPIGTGAMLPSGSSLDVGKGGRCLVRLSNGTGVFLRDGSTALFRDDGVDLTAGEAWFEVPALEDQLFTVNAGTTRIGAEKAGFDVRIGTGETRVMVVRGLAVVESTGGRSEVGTGENAKITSGGAPQISAIDFWEDWTGGMADHGVLPSTAGRASGRIYAIDRSRAGAPPQELQVREQVVRAWIRDGIARTEVTQTFFNPSGAPVEGWYWFTLPDGAAVTRFAMVVGGQVVEGEVVERKQAAASYEAAVQRAFDPALLEWVDGRTYRARIFPVPAAGDRQVILGYSELLPCMKDTTRYVYPMGDGATQRIQEFSLAVDVGSSDLDVSTVKGARIEQGQKTRLVTMRRSGFTPHGDFLLEMKAREAPNPLRAIRHSTGRNEADYVMIRYAPEEDWDAVPAPEGVVVVVVDTSGGGEEGERKQKNDAVEAILRALSAGDRFALVSVDVTPRLVYPVKEGLSAADDASIQAALERLSEVPTGGATDLGDCFNFALKLVHGATQPGVVYIGDGLPTVGELRSAEIVERLKRSLSGSRARLFTVAVGLHANLALLDRLASVGGGMRLRIDLPEQTVQRAIEFVGALKTPTITDLRIDAGAGLDQVFATGSGKVTRGQEVVLLGRTHHPLPPAITVIGSLAGKVFKREYRVSERKGPGNGYVAPLWAMEYLRFLLGTGVEDNRGQVIALGLEYSLMTPFTSFLVLENNQAYAQAGIVRRDRDEAWRGPASGTEAKDDARPGAPAPSYESPAPPPAPSRVMPAVKTEAEIAPMEESRSIGGLRAASADISVRGAPGGMRPMRKADSGWAGMGSAARGAGGDDGRVKVVQARLSVPPPREPQAQERVDLATGKGVLLPSPMPGPDQPSEVLGVCSDASRRPLAVRIDLWQRRLGVVSGIAAALEVYRQAARDCEIDGWKAEQALLVLVLTHVRSPADVGFLIGSFHGRARVQDFLRTELLRRVVVAGAVGMPTLVNWAGVDAVLATITDTGKRIEVIRRVLALRPGDPEGQRRLLLLLVEIRQAEEAIQVATLLRDAGFGSPEILFILGDLLAAKGDAEGARRAYSEVVENNPWDARARRMLGDAFLRNSWPDDAYRQYSTLQVMAGQDPSSLIRLARAAAGAGRTDEALRVLKKIFELTLERSTSDPRDWARMWSVEALARLMIAAEQAADKEKSAAVARAIKRTEAFRGPAKLFLLTWQDLDADLALKMRRAGAEVPSTDALTAGDTGLVAAWAPPSGEQPSTVVEWGHRSLKRPVPWRLTTVSFDGRDFKVAESSGSLPPPAPPVVKGK